MKERVSFEYAVIRFVPRVEREEFINIGVILFCKNKKYIRLLYQLERVQPHYYDHDFDLNLIEDYLKAYSHICKGDSIGGPIAKLDAAERFRWITATKSTIIQTSKVQIGLCKDPEKMLAHIFEEMVL